MVDDGFGESAHKLDDQALAYPASEDDEASVQQDRRESLTVPEVNGSNGSNGATPNGDQYRRQRRRVESDRKTARSPSNTSFSGRSQSPAYPAPTPHPALLPKRSQASLSGKRKSISPATPEIADDESDDERSGSGEDELALAVGQLSMNEDAQVRYHGKASGLHLLGISERCDGRSEGGIWYV